MKINQAVEQLVRRHIESYLAEHNEATLTELLDSYVGPYIKEAEFRNAVNNALIEGYLQKVDADQSIGYTRIRQVKPFPPSKTEGFKIVISRPRLQGVGLLSRQLRNEYEDSRVCFESIIKSSDHTLRICSPFLESNVTNADAFPQITKLLADTFLRGVNVFVLSRELFNKRGHQLRWIIELAESLNSEEKLRIVDYHIPGNNWRVISSTHAKILISDIKAAYIGSAELRRNSLVANFEVGCYISGPQVIGICEIFDAMFESGRLWYAGEGDGRSSHS